PALPRPRPHAAVRPDRELLLLRAAARRPGGDRVLAQPALEPGAGGAGPAPGVWHPVLSLRGPVRLPPRLRRLLSLWRGRRPGAPVGPVPLPAVVPGRGRRDGRVAPHPASHRPLRRGGLRRVLPLPVCPLVSQAARPAGPGGGAAAARRPGPGGGGRGR